MKQRSASPPPAPPVVRRRPLRQRLTGWAFVLPFAIPFLLAVVAPIVYTAGLSLFRERLIGGVSFVGLGNYREQLSDPRFWDGITRVGIFLVIQVPLMMLFALGAALALDSARLYAPSVFRLGIFLPYAVPGVVASLLWGYIYGAQFGLVGDIKEMFGVALPDPLSSALILPSISNIGLWLYVGYNMLVFYAALQAIPSELFEAARIDGAGTWHVIVGIKLPAIRGTLVFTTIFSVIGGFQLFNEPNILRDMVPNVISTDFTPNMYAYTLSFAGQQYNSAATVAMIMGLVTGVVAFVVQRRGMKGAV
ncbi:sugar ABC transporter permease (plasmid) [Streptomyces sp. HUAS 31]|uniref:carbohydrate ABC transporter permease n=1 Tax=Streptomyces TaxID=1883 RepID=UPI00230676C4|nr:sugar ABC transporter permease [Streptomyces sp. HUAS 31]WCE02428.1 sugar ABC transporter permease [Streptomyces sp. HUAS 31]